MARVNLKQVDKIYPGNVQVVFKNDIDVQDKEFVVFVGPSGCGKSTTLRMIAGLEEITAGDLYIDDERMNDVPPKDRNIAMVFQNYALYPHMTVRDNMAFGLKIRKFPKEDIDKRVDDAAEMLHIKEYLDRKPKALSGGQRQRVAMGRAIVRRPKVFLFDEPLSNLDAKLRVTMRAEISRLAQKLQTTMIYVTHDQVEAMTMADRIVVMYNGHIQQYDTPLNLYNNPANKFVAGFIGSPPMNFIKMKVAKEGSDIVVKHEDFTLTPTADQQKKLTDYVGQEVTFGIRPEDLHEKDFQDNKIVAEVDVVEPLGAEVYVYISTSDNSSLTCRLDPSCQIKVKDKIALGVNMAKAHFFEVEPKQTNEWGKMEEICIV